MKISRPKKIAALVGSGIGVVGIGLAAVLLTTTITGSATIINVPGTGSGPGGNGGGVSDQVSVDVTAGATNGSNLNCSKIEVSKDSKSLRFNPVLSKPAANGPNADSQPIQGGSCTISLTVRNTGDVAIKVSSAALEVKAAGWTVSDPTGLEKTILSGDSQQLTAKITATQAAEEGDVVGKLVYTEVQPSAAP